MPVPPRLKEALLRHKAQSAFNRPEDFIFCRQDGRASSADYLRRSVLYPAMDRAGIKRTSRDYGFHILRHSGATIAHKEMGLKQAQNLLRHSKSATTADIYIFIHLKRKPGTQWRYWRRRSWIFAPSLPHLKPLAAKQYNESTTTEMMIVSCKHLLGKEKDTFGCRFNNQTGGCKGGI